MRSRGHDWMPGKREEILSMVQSWCETILKNPHWGVPTEKVTDLTTKATVAQSALGKAMSVERTVVVTALCREAFAALEKAMRDMKRRYFLSPPLTEADFVQLGLRPADTVSTAILASMREATGDLNPLDRHRVRITRIRAILVEGITIDLRSEEMVEIAIGVLDAEDVKYRISEIPKSGDGLPYKIITARKLQEVFDLIGESGKTLICFVRFDAGRNRKGPWGPMLQVIIP